MPLHPLSVRVIVGSWATALGAWPLAWLVTVVSQGFGTVAVGGEWIGVSLPLGDVPWALVNEPSIAFASSRPALLGYWLPAIAIPAVLVLALPILAPTGGGWIGELILFHLTAGLAVTNLGWAVALGRASGPAAGLETFWRVEPALTTTLALAAGVVGASLALVRLGGQFWHAPGGPTRWRRILLTLAHVAVPAAAWAAASSCLGWELQLLPTAGVCAVVVGGLIAAVAYVPRSSLRRPGRLRAGSVVGIAFCSVTVALTFAWLGAPERGRPRALIWGQESATSNLRPGTVTYRLMPLPVRTTPPAPSGAGS